ncbi:MAG: hypothetical protein QN702_09340 [Nitrososphaeraceae archaeon]|nr:hypothetical protein [Nitrososphaeraceae archaeon]
MIDTADMNFETVFFGFCGLVGMIFIILGFSFANIYAISIGIKSPLPGQEVPVGELTIFGTSSDNSTSNCQVYVDWNNLKPYQLVTPTGVNDSSDFSTWNFTYTSKYHLIQGGPNELTSKIICLVSPAGPTVSKWSSINVTGISSANQSASAKLPLPAANFKS